VLKVVEVRHRVSIAGWVTDAGAQKPLGGVAVNIVEMPPAFKSVLRTKAMQYGSRWRAMPERPDRTRTAPDGLFYFLDLPDGKYTIAASLVRFGKRYGAAQCSAAVSRVAKGGPKVAYVQMGLRPTTVEGKVTGSAHKTGVIMAEIRVKGSGERVFTDAQGQYVLAGVEPGKRTILAVAQGYRPAAKPVTIEQPGGLATLNFALVREAAG
jgi:Carboxypeptidase regulatory-like domain